MTPSAPSEPCAGVADGCACAACVALREAATAGARPAGVPIRIYGAYLEARGALRSGAPALAIVALEWLLAHLAEERGARPDQDLSATLRALRAEDVISQRVAAALFDRALAKDADETGRAWALLSIAEHAFHRLYL